MNKIIIDEITSEKLEALGWTPPAKPEIPEGCPVLIMYQDDEGKGYDDEDGFYRSDMDQEGFTIEVDYTRKGHVIPWNGGDCPVDDDAKVTYWMLCGDDLSGWDAGNLRWSHIGLDGDIIAYFIWPDYLTTKDKGKRD